MSEPQESIVAPALAASATTLEQRWYVLLMMCLVYTLSIADLFVAKLSGDAA